MDDWVLDSLVGFLKSPTWSSAVSSFTDKNCVGESSSSTDLCCPPAAMRVVFVFPAVFDPGEENKFSYTDIHREYQKLVSSISHSK